MIEQESGETHFSSLFIGPGTGLPIDPDEGPVPGELASA